MILMFNPLSANVKYTITVTLMCLKEDENLLQNGMVMLSIKLSQSLEILFES